MTPYNIKSKLPFGFQHPELAMFIKIFLIIGMIWYLGLGIWLLVLYIHNKHASSKRSRKIQHRADTILEWSLPITVIIAVIIAILIHLS